jgi:PAS domain S-box-containing protein
MPASNVRAALRLATIYVVVAGLWIVFSDRAVESLVRDPALFSRAQSVKGMGFVVVTGLMLFLLMRYELHLRAASERREREREAHFRAVFESDVVGMVLWRDDGRVVDANEAFARMIGRRRDALAAEGATLAGLAAPESREPCRARLDRLRLEGSCPPFPMEFLRADGTPLPALVGAARLPGRAGEGVVFVLDFTAQRALEAQLQHAQKLQAVGVLAGGVAHDFNNLLTAILGYTELCVEQAPPDRALRQNLDEIRRAGRRASELTRQLLAFGRKQVLHPRVVDVNQVVRGVEDLLRQLAGERVELVTQLAPGLDAVRVDPGQLEQVLVNLAVNGRDAMAGGGRLSIRTSPRAVSAEEAARHPGASPGPHVAIAVTDTGAGMDEGTMEHVFEPFFTTKETGKGTGLGLSSVYGIVAQSGGFVEVRSAPGAGSTFTVVLPAAQASFPEEVPAVPGVVVPGAGTVLLVEDDDAVLRLARRTLEGAGWNVLCASCGEDALRVADAHRGEIDMVLTDSVMPGLDGRETVARLRERRPGLRALLMSGYARSAGQERQDGTDPMLDKPFTPRDLLRAVEERLART